MIPARWRRRTGMIGAVLLALLAVGYVLGAAAGASAQGAECQYSATLTIEGRIVSGADISVLQTGATTTTDTSGRFTIPIPGPGVWTVRALHPGITPYTMRLEVGPGCRLISSTGEGGMPLSLLQPPATPAPVRTPSPSPTPVSTPSPSPTPAPVSTPTPAPQPDITLSGSLLEGGAPVSLTLSADGRTLRAWRLGDGPAVIATSPCGPAFTGFTWAGSLELDGQAFTLTLAEAEPGYEVVVRGSIDGETATGAVQWRNPEQPECDTAPVEWGVPPPVAPVSAEPPASAEPPPPPAPVLRPGEFMSPAGTWRVARARIISRFPEDCTVDCTVARPGFKLLMVSFEPGTAGASVQPLSDGCRERPSRIRIISDTGDSAGCAISGSSVTTQGGRQVSSDIYIVFAVPQAARAYRLEAFDSPAIDLGPYLR